MRYGPLLFDSKIPEGHYNRWDLNGCFQSVGPIYITGPLHDKTMNNSMVKSIQSVLGVYKLKHARRL